MRDSKNIEMKFRDKIGFIQKLCMKVREEVGLLTQDQDNNVKRLRVVVDQNSSSVIIIESVSDEVNKNRDDKIRAIKSIYQLILQEEVKQKLGSGHTVYYIIGSNNKDNKLEKIQETLLGILEIIDTINLKETNKNAVVLEALRKSRLELILRTSQNNRGVSFQKQSVMRQLLQNMKNKFKQIILEPPEYSIYLASNTSGIQKTDGKVKNICDSTLHQNSVTETSPWAQLEAWAKNYLEEKHKKRDETLQQLQVYLATIINVIGSDIKLSKQIEITLIATQGSEEELYCKLDFNSCPGEMVKKFFHCLHELESDIKEDLLINDKEYTIIFAKDITDISKYEELKTKLISINKGHRNKYAQENFLPILREIISYIDRSENHDTLEACIHYLISSVTDKDEIRQVIIDIFRNNKSILQLYDVQDKKRTLVEISITEIEFELRKIEKMLKGYKNKQDNLAENNVELGEWSIEYQEENFFLYLKLNETINEETIKYITKNRNNCKLKINKDEKIEGIIFNDDNEAQIYEEILEHYDETEETKKQIIKNLQTVYNALYNTDFEVDFISLNTIKLKCCALEVAASVQELITCAIQSQNLDFDREKIVTQEKEVLIHDIELGILDKNVEDLSNRTEQLTTRLEKINTKLLERNKDATLQKSLNKFTINLIVDNFIINKMKNIFITFPLNMDYKNRIDGIIEYRKLNKEISCEPESEGSRTIKLIFAHDEDHENILEKTKKIISSITRIEDIVTQTKESFNLQDDDFLHGIVAYNQSIMLAFCFYDDKFHIKLKGTKDSKIQTKQREGKRNHTFITTEIRNIEDQNFKLIDLCYIISKSRIEKIKDNIEKKLSSDIKLLNKSSYNEYKIEASLDDKNKKLVVAIHNKRFKQLKVKQKINNHKEQIFAFHDSNGVIIEVPFGEILDDNITERFNNLEFLEQDKNKQLAITVGILSFAISTVTTINLLNYFIKNHNRLIITSVFSTLLEVIAATCIGCIVYHIRDKKLQSVSIEEISEESLSP